MEAFIILCTLFIAAMTLGDLREILGSDNRETVKERIRRKKNFFD